MRKATAPNLNPHNNRHVISTTGANSQNKMPAALPPPPGNPPPPTLAMRGSNKSDYAASNTFAMPVDPGSDGGLNATAQTPGQRLDKAAKQKARKTNPSLVAHLSPRAVIQVFLTFIQLGSGGDKLAKYRVAG